MGIVKATMRSTALTSRLLSTNHAAQPRGARFSQLPSGGLRISRTSAGNVAACAPPLPTIMATYCLPLAR